MALGRRLLGYSCSEPSNRDDIEFVAGNGFVVLEACCQCVGMGKDLFNGHYLSCFFEM